MPSLKLSEAIRLGCMLHPVQGFADLYEMDNHGNVIAACAMGAAEAAGWLDADNGKREHLCPARVIRSVGGQLSTKPTPGNGSAVLGRWSFT